MFVFVLLGFDVITLLRTFFLGGLGFFWNHVHVGVLRVGESVVFFLTAPRSSSMG